MNSSDFREKLKEILESCVNKMLKNDHHLLENKVHEGSISFRIGHYLQNELDTLKLYRLNIPENLVVDAEYNKFLDESKICIDECKMENPMRPDLIVHVRGKNGPDNNFMAIEIKKSVDGSCKKKRDYTKLSCLTSGNYEFKYQTGAHIIIDVVKRKIKDLKWFKDGEPED